ncbi:hypothetical protein LXA43DRAFT_237529 [Ganoderma leucocontextum]|nr:hypothetical protein LXA43DRAFT_237529 [Ganoderma leucocontextum]
MPRNMQHRRRPIEELAERAPALIDLPFSLPSIPLLGPILTPLIDGPPPKTTTPSTPSTPQPTTAPQPTTTTQAAPPPQTPTTTQPSNPQSPTTSPNAPPTGDGNGNGSTSSNVSNPEPSAGSAPSSPSESNPSGSPPSSGSSPSDSSSSPGISLRPGSPVITISGDGQAFFPSSQTSSLAQETGGSTYPSGTTQASLPTYSGTMTGSATGAPTNPTNVDADPVDPAQAGSTHHGLSGGITAAIVIVSVLLGFVVLLCCMRRRAIAARVRRRREWFAGGATQDMGYADRDAAAGPSSARSSFATNFDHGQIASGLPTFDFTTLQTPQTMQQIWPSDLSGSILAVPPASRTVESSSSPTVRVTTDRSSIHSGSSGPRSRPLSQASSLYLVVPPPAAEASPSLSPISVRPFSPTESWSFPKPPKDDESGRLASQIRSGSIANSSQSSGSFPAEKPQNPVAVAENPFAEPENPFADPTSVSSPESAVVPFTAIETIRRPFVPSMHDEMAVNVGDQVRVVRRFDDGWVVAQNVSTGAQGLVPLDRMRDDEKEVPAPAFLARKRVSSYVRPRDSVLTRASVMSGTSTIGAAI